jgi:uncharacterized tellurite resistance protein B-like protein
MFASMKNTLPFSHEAEASAAILFACLRANELGEFAENATFHTALRHRNIFKSHDAAALIAAAERHYEQAGSPTALIDAAAASVRPQTREPLFLQCVDVIFADGLVTPLEHRVIQFLTRKLEIDRELAAKALEVLLAKNQL